MRSPERAHLDRIWDLPRQSKTAYLEMMIEGYDTLETLRTVCGSLLTIVPFLTNRESLLNVLYTGYLIAHAGRSAGSLAKDIAEPYGESVRRGPSNSSRLNKR